MSKEDAEGLDLYLKIGMAVSVQGESKQELAATVVAISPGLLRLEVSRPSSETSLQEGEKVEIKYWDTKAVLYYWDSEVMKVAGPESRHVTIGVGRSATLQRRKSYRVRLPIPFSFTVIDAAETQLIDEKVRNSTIQNISVGGLAFETPLPLQREDKSEMHLSLTSSQEVTVVGWVVRSEPVKDKGEDLHLVALMFLQLSAGEQSQLLKFLAEVEARK